MKKWVLTVMSFFLEIPLDSSSAAGHDDNGEFAEKNNEREREERKRGRERERERERGLFDLRLPNSTTQTKRQA